MMADFAEPGMNTIDQPGKVFLFGQVITCEIPPAGCRRALMPVPKGVQFHNHTRHRPHLRAQSASQRTAV